MAWHRRTFDQELGTTFFVRRLATSLGHFFAGSLGPLGQKELTFAEGMLNRLHSP